MKHYASGYRSFGHKSEEKYESEKSEKFEEVQQEEELQ